MYTHFYIFQRHPAGQTGVFAVRFWAPSLIFYTPGLYGYVVPKPWPQHTTNNPATDTTMGNLRCSLIFQGVAAVLVLTGVDITLHAPTRLYLHCYM